MQRLRPLVILFHSLFFVLPSLAQTQSIRRPLEMENEKPAFPYLPNAHRNQRTTPAYHYQTTGGSGTSIITVQVNVDSMHMNIVDDAANEPSIAINPLNPNQISIGWRQFDNISSDFRQAGYAYSTDGGLNWTFPNRIDSGIFRSDPVLDYDADGGIYYNSLTVPGYYCEVFKSVDGGQTWDSGTPAKGGDKQWMAIDRSTDTTRGNIYTAWSSFATSCDGIFTRSLNNGVSYDSCSYMDSDPHFGTMDLDDQGNVYVCGWDFNNDVAVCAYSTDANDGSVAIPNWTSTIVNMDGTMAFNNFINPAGLAGQLNINIDRSGGLYNGRVYMLGAVQSFFSGDPSDIVFVKRTSLGVLWSNPILINDDNSPLNTQWLGTMSVAPNGRIDVVWLDNRASVTNSDSSALYYSYSNDGGTTWSVNERLSELFDPHVGYPIQQKMGDYFDMISENGGARLAWAATFNGEQDVYYSYIQPAVPASIISLNNFSVTVSPNPFADQLRIQSSENNLHAEITSPLGQIVFSKSIVSNEVLQLSSLPSGIYFLNLISEKGIKVTKRIVKG